MNASPYDVVTMLRLAVLALVPLAVAFVPHLPSHALRRATATARPAVVDSDEIVELANDGQGMSWQERLRCLINCLRGNRAKTYRVSYKFARRAGEVKKDPQKVYEMIKDKLMRFVETIMEKETRVLTEWDVLHKGNLTALQFEPWWDKCLADLDEVAAQLDARLARRGGAAKAALLEHLRTVPRAPPLGRPLPLRGGSQGAAREVGAVGLRASAVAGIGVFAFRALPAGVDPFASPHPPPAPGSAPPARRGGPRESARSSRSLSCSNPRAVPPQLQSVSGVSGSMSRNGAQKDALPLLCS